ncbi:YdcF family protein [Dinghuibacter silviterrae]|uniref:DUF218 domain-containing protein n=1 Tax=Dinghuibacter silviterrae TaxID=1539049 RepID=A0A4R8DG37_9BACT|nr:YdcF family protein [Dinghuibacter silviterrae]TDW96214.1 DUF218 domain-containing protein [Dinghuibacter silviterrae]
MRLSMGVSFLTLLTISVHAQTAWDPHYTPVRSGSWIQDKDFYLFTLMEGTAVKTAVQNEPFFANLLTSKDSLLGSIVHARGKSPQEFIKAFVWTPEEITSVDSALCLVCAKSPKVMGVLAAEMRRSGCWIRDASLNDSALVRKAWEDAALKENRVITNYTTNKGFRYAAIDSATFGPGSPIAREMLGEMLMMLWHGKDKMSAFFQPSLETALNILFINNRDEAGRFEPLDSTNRPAYTRVTGTVWKNFPYSAILIPGEGPENEWPMSPMGKYRCQLGAEAYRAGKAPFLIVSGGFVHPFQTPYCEAEEMKEYLIHVLGVPAEAVILEPHARHTTTNIRNANRILLRKGFPPDKRVLCMSTAGQTAYIEAPFFAARCRMEMGYVPFTDLHAEDAFGVSYRIDPASLQMDAIDPLDP